MWLEGLFLCYSLEPVVHQYLTVLCKKNPFLRLRIKLRHLWSPCDLRPCVFNFFICELWICSLLEAQKYLFSWNSKNLGCSFVPTNLPLPLDMTKGDAQATAMKQISASLEFPHVMQGAVSSCMALNKDRISKKTLVHKLREFDKFRQIRQVWPELLSWAQMGS